MGYTRIVRTPEGLLAPWISPRGEHVYLLDYSGRWWFSIGDRGMNASRPLWRSAQDQRRSR
jgi:hypothetical protein